MNKDELKDKFGKEADKYYKVRLFDEVGFKRQSCKNCNNHFWSILERDYCADCEPYGFINDPPTTKRLDYIKAWKEIERFFVNNKHTSIKRYPVVCRWREDLFFTVASIVDFQRIIGGKVVFEFPYNPLIVPQICLRFNDIENVGVSGKHYTAFCMIGQHSIYNEEGGYWKDECIELDYKLLTDILGIKKEDVIFQEDVWIGYGALGYSLEYFVKGLELGNAVFTEFEGTPDNYKEMREKVIDMGAGLERFSWITMGTPTSYDCCFGPMVKEFIDRLGIEHDLNFLSRYFTLVSKNIERYKDLATLRLKIARELNINLDRLKDIIIPLESLYTILDHTRALIFAIADGALPSNVGGGHNLRVILRRVLSILSSMKWRLDLDEIIDMHVEYLKDIYPELIEHKEEVKIILDIERGRYQESLSRIKNTIERIKKERKELTINDLIRLYESDGITPDILKEYNVIEEVPQNLYTMLSEKYITQKVEEPKPIIESLNYLKPTQLLYYENEDLFEFEAEIVEIHDRYIVLDRTAFYARGGGQEPDRGYINNSYVKDVIKQGDVVLHEVDNVDGLRKGMRVRCNVDENRRKAITRHHTATHVINAAARKVLGSWVWQHSAFKDIDYARLDITHHSPLSREEIKKIEELANMVVFRNVPIEVEVYDRNEAEKRFGFRIYQGGYVPSRSVRIVKVKDWDIEACAGTHCKKTGEIGLIKIIKSERVQDGVVRLEYVAGDASLRYIQSMEDKMIEIANVLNSNKDKVVESVKKVVKEEENVKRMLKIVYKRLAEDIVPIIVSKAKSINSIRLYSVYDDVLDENYHINVGERAIEYDKGLVYIALVKVSDSIRVITFVGSDAIEKGYDASYITRQLAKILGGSGGGNKRFGQGGGKFIDRYKEALESINDIINDRP